MRRLLLIALSVALALVALGREARANSRFPASNALFFSPTDPELLLLRTTFGVMVSPDRGKTWDWICERSLNVTGDEDPMFAITPEGTFIASTFGGVAITRDRGCSFSHAGGEPEGLVFVDVVARPERRGDVFAFASSFDFQNDAGDLFFRSALYETTDEGRSFTRTGPFLDPTLLGETVDVTATDPDRIYLTTVRDYQTSPKGVLLVSRDRGKTWTEDAIPLEPGERAAFIAAVDPKNADRVYLRTAGQPEDPSRLLVTDDAGKTYRVVFRAQSGLSGFALSPDGSKIWVGSTTDGLHMASTTDFAFQQRSTIEVQCLAWAPDGLWACSSERSGFVAGVSHDEGVTFETKLRFCDVRGPLTCPPGTSTHVECAGGGTGAAAISPWPTLRGLLGCGPDAGTDAGTGDAGESAADAFDAGGGCSASTRSASPLVAALAFAAALVAAMRRRR
ncbi:MAG: hypothetical protein KF819_34970 [Labilithrix sp.]|nr:hypothetical protein [Labilithrix sp.]